MDGLVSGVVEARCESRQRALLFGQDVAGLLYMNNETGEITADPDEVLSWLSEGVEAVVHGYYTFEWKGDELHEVWHQGSGFDSDSDCGRG